MGKAAKAHRAKVAKRNANMKVKEKRMQKLWQELFDEKLKTLQDEFAKISGDTLTGITQSTQDEEEKTEQEKSEPTEPVSGE